MTNLFLTYFYNYLIGGSKYCRDEDSYLDLIKQVIPYTPGMYVRGRSFTSLTRIPTCMSLQQGGRAHPCIFPPFHQ